MNETSGYFSNVIIDKSKGIVYKKYKDFRDMTHEFNNEVEALKRLEDCDFVPNIIDYDYNRKTIIMTYMGNTLDYIFNTNKEYLIAQTLSSNYKDKIYDMLSIMASRGIYHTDLHWLPNICYMDSKIYIIDFNNVKLYDIDDPKFDKNKIYHKMLYDINKEIIGKFDYIQKNKINISNKYQHSRFNIMLILISIIFILLIIGIIKL